MSSRVTNDLRLARTSSEAFIIQIELFMTTTTRVPTMSSVALAHLEDAKTHFRVVSTLWEDTLVADVTPESLLKIILTQLAVLQALQFANQELTDLIKEDFPSVRQFVEFTTARQDATQSQSDLCSIVY